MANPKRRTSKARKRKRRSHLALPSTNLTPCPQCGSQKIPHRVCEVCGQYAGKDVLEKEEEI